MGDNLIEQSVKLLRVKDPLFKRMGASRIIHFATDDEKRMKVVELGEAHGLVNLLKAVKDDRTRKEALRALVTCRSEFDFLAMLLFFSYATLKM
ncbi:hypothetical protein GIB67_041864 [Kingdonia uniflora]|uniref:Uncharacterized protein n=1 Tax=Kingdonia uniflora TaxID=39325 RepID=A0A7J7L5S3_9MAGN|nr:hypothetical protein GIB67_041864 [Kingdonia uniflora]